MAASIMITRVIEPYESTQPMKTEVLGRKILSAIYTLGAVILLAVFFVNVSNTLVLQVMASIIVAFGFIRPWQPSDVPKLVRKTGYCLVVGIGLFWINVFVEDLLPGTTWWMVFMAMAGIKLAWIDTARALGIKTSLPVAVLVIGISIMAIYGVLLGATAWTILALAASLSLCFFIPWICWRDPKEYVFPPPF